MSNRLGGFIAGQNISASIGTVTFANTPDITFGSVAGTPAVGTPVQFTTTGTLPTGISLNTTYYVISLNSNTCQVSTTISGSATTYTNSTGSGTHTAVTQRAFSPYAGAPDTVEYLVIAGGGGGGQTNETPTGGGGGAGGLLQGVGYPVAAGTALTITVGAGGAGGIYTGPPAGQVGTASVFSGISTVGGGGGATYNGTGTKTVTSGGSGGGGTWSIGSPVGSGGAGTVGQGFAGGRNSGSGNMQAGGGGGGSGGNGDNADPSRGVNNGANGGAGTCSTITGSRVFYAGGGGSGGAKGQAPFGIPGLGSAGGGNGGRAFDGSSVYAQPGFAATANTGSGGGGGGANLSNGPAGGVLGGNGGSGIVILRYPQINAAPALVTGSPQVNYSDGYQIYTWTSSGSIIF